MDYLSVRGDLLEKSWSQMSCLLPRGSARAFIIFRAEGSAFPRDARRCCIDRISPTRHSRHTAGRLAFVCACVTACCFFFLSRFVRFGDRILRTHADFFFKGV